VASDTVLLVGKIVFVLSLYGFIYAVFRGMMAETRRSTRVPAGGKTGEARGFAPGPSRAAGTPSNAPRPVPQQPMELRPRGAGSAGASSESVTLRPAPPPAPLPGVPQPTVPVVPPAEVVSPAAVVEVTEVSPPRPSPPPPPAAESVGPSEGARLVVLTSPEASLTVGQRIDVAGTVRFGRGEENDLVLKDRFVSGRHAEVARSGSGYVLRDLGSTNGTFRNGMRIQGECPLSAGDRIGIGTSVFAFHQGA